MGDRPTTYTGKRGCTIISRAGFGPTVPVFERYKTIHALDCAATRATGKLLRKYVIKL
jgi:hypothetical protein